MTTVIKKLFSLSLAATLAMLASCSATARFKSVGKPPVWRDTSELPVPDDGTVEPNSLRIALQCPTIEEDEEFVSQLKDAVIAQCRNAGMGEVKLLPRGSSKKAHYEIMVYEAGEDGKFDFNAEAGIWTGVGTGVATGILTKSVGNGIIGGVAGGAAGGFLFGDKKDVYAFAGVCRQRTSLSATKTADAGEQNRTSTGGGTTDQDTATRSSADSGQQMLEHASWNLKTQAFEFPFMFHIAVDGGSLSKKGTRDAAARETFLKKFPKYVTGGTVIG